MKEKYFYIKSEKAREILSQTKKMRPVKNGVDSHVYLIDEYAILTTSRIKLRNVETHDDDLAHFDELIETLMTLYKQGVKVVPILGYCYDPNSDEGDGYIFQMQAKGEELYDDAVMKEFYLWTHKYPEQSKHLSSDADPYEYIMSRTNYMSKVPQKHFDKFINDIIVLLDNDILIDFHGKSNFFYDSADGFQFIDLDSHTDYRYGLVKDKPDSKEMASRFGFIPCHFAIDPEVLPEIALDLEERIILRLGDTNLQQLILDNKTIFEKCKTAMLNNGISAEQMNNSLKKFKPFIKLPANLRIIDNTTGLDSVVG